MQETYFGCTDTHDFLARIYSADTYEVTLYTRPASDNPVGWTILCTQEFSAKYQLENFLHGVTDEWTPYA